MNQETKNKFERTIWESTEERDQVRSLVDAGHWINAEKDEKRKGQFILKHKLRNKSRGKESQIGDTLDWIDTAFLTEGSIMKQAVGYVIVKLDGESTTGSGFMVSNQLFITNNHVISSPEKASKAIVTFNKENDEYGVPMQTTSYKLDPKVFFETSPEDQLDFSIIGLGERIIGKLDPLEIGHFILSDASDKHVVGMNVNIIQHPLDLPKKVTFRKNTIVYRTDNSLLYETDTETGSSGSPVLNDDWELVALHHWGEPYRAKLDNPNSDLPNYVNEGIRISSIYKHLSNIISALPNSQKDILLEALSFARTNPLMAHKMPARRKDVAPQPQQVAESGKGIDQGKAKSAIQIENTSQTIKITIPIEVTIRFGNMDIGNVNSISQGSSVPEKVPLISRAEASKIDRNYSNRSGYDPNFLSGYELPMPKVKVKSDIAPLHADQLNYQDGVLDYEHFSLVLNRSKRCAFYTATNIDGSSYKFINRTTGEISDINQQEGETWYGDDRVDPDYHLNQPFFSGWSHLFDRGHLTRRTDPSWGPDTVALRADADTFHFSNCSIQHFRFNQTVKYWQGIEQYILEKGVISDGEDNKLTVIQGPVYNDDIDYWAEDFQIPSRYFKIAVWRGNGGKLRAVGLVADQSTLLTEERRTLGRSKPPGIISIEEWRMAIKEIEKLTNLDFGKEIRDADTIAQGQQPVVGAEAVTKRLITSWDDFKI